MKRNTPIRTLLLSTVLAISCGISLSHAQQGTLPQTTPELRMGLEMMIRTGHYLREMRRLDILGRTGLCRELGKLEAGQELVASYHREVSGRLSEAEYDALPENYFRLMYIVANGDVSTLPGVPRIASSIGLAGILNNACFTQGSMISFTDQQLREIGAHLGEQADSLRELLDSTSP